MSSSRVRRLLLRAAATDRTFRRVDLDGEPALAGKCIHCNRRLVVPFDSRVPASGTVEHIVPRSHGGTDDPENLAVACRGCNNDKGIHHDHRSWDDPQLQRVIALLRERRQKRQRQALDGVPID